MMLLGETRKFIHSFRLFLYRLFMSTTTQRRSRNSADTVPGMCVRVCALECISLDHIMQWRFYSTLVCFVRTPNTSFGRLLLGLSASKFFRWAWADASIL